MQERRQERKLVSVVFCDLVGFTGRAEVMDPEDVGAMLSAYHHRLRTELERHGGTGEKFIGDAVVAVFGAPTVGRSILTGEPATAADALTRMAAHPDAAYARLRAGGEHIREALKFYESVGATSLARQAIAALETTA